MPLLQRKHTIAAPLHSLPISLCAANGAAIHTFPADLISSIRHLENTLTYNNTLPKCLAVVAALSGEGVTYMSIALATTLANDRQASVCVAELNWYTPGMITRLSQPAPARPPRHKRPADALADSEPFDGGPGLAGVLTQSCTLDQALVATATPNLYLLPAGDLPQHLRPAMARGTALKQCLAQLCERFDMLVLDIPAVQLTSDAVALASLAQGCCLVIRQGVTPVSHVRAALDDLAHLNILGVILNQVSSKLPRWMHALVPQE